MESEAGKRCRLLAKTICGVFRQGLALNRETIHFIDSTLLTPSIQQLQEKMSIVDDSEVEIIYSLVFYPDENMQIQLEEILETQNFQKKDEQTVSEHLVTSCDNIPVYFSDNRGALYLTMPEPIACQFVSRLNIHKKINGGLLKEIHRHVPESRRSRVKIKLRNARFKETKNRISFLCNYFEKMKDGDGQCLEMVLSLFEEGQKDTDMYEMLTRRKQWYFRSIQKAKKYQEMLKKDNVETLLLRGIRIPSIDVADAEEKMKIIDQICRSVYGKTEYFWKTQDIVEDWMFRSEDGTNA